MLHRLIPCLTLMFAANIGLADVTQSAAISTLEAGIICPPDGMETAPAPDTLAGSTHIITEEPPFVSNARQVPAALGVGFGIKAQAVVPEGISAVTLQITHPPMGDQGQTRQSFQTNISGQGPSVTFYQFDHRYELVEGAWTMTAFTGETQLFSVGFDVVDPRRVPELAGACNFLDLLS